jgi:hypothetical protein
VVIFNQGTTFCRTSCPLIFMAPLEVWIEEELTLLFALLQDCLSPDDHRIEDDVRGDAGWRSSL